MPRRKKTDGGNEILLEPEFHATLQKGLNRLQQTDPAQTDFGKCPAPDDSTADERERYAAS